MDPPDAARGVSDAAEAPDGGGSQQGFTGRVLDENGWSVAGATVSIGEASIQTSEDGTFALPAPPGDRRVINVQKEGYVPVSRVHVSAGTMGLLMVLSRADVTALDPSTTDIEDQSGTRIALSVPVQEALVNDQGEPPSGRITAQMHTYDLVEDEMVGSLEAVDAGGNPVMMKSMGAVFVGFVGEDGTPYQLRPGQSVQMSVELPAGVQYSGPIPIWYYDMQQGRWIEEGQGLVQEGLAFMNFSHAAIWSFGSKRTDAACIKVTASDGLLAAGASVQARVKVLEYLPRVRKSDLGRGGNVIYNLPPSTNIEIFVPAHATVPLATVNTGLPWGDVGAPPTPYNSCNMDVTLPVTLLGQLGGFALLQGRAVHAGITVQVRDEAGAAVASTTTDQLGRYAVSVLPGSYDVELVHPSYVRALISSVTVSGGEPQHLPCMQLLGGDVDQDGGIDSTDVDSVFAGQGSSPSSGDPADVNGDGVIDSQDLELVQGNLGVLGPLTPGDPYGQCRPVHVTDIAAGSNHTCALTSDGRVRCWGSSSVGQLGYGNVNSVGDDETLIGLTQSSMHDSVAQLAAGGFHTCVVVYDASSNRNVRCWGYNLSGQLGYGNTNNIGDNEPSADISNISVGLAADNSIAKVTAGLFHTCVLTAAGRVHCWGQNDYGQLGYGDTEDIGDDESVSSKGAVNVGGNVIDIVAGSYHTCALLTDRKSVKCWGNNQFGQLGYGHTNHVGDDEEPASVTAVVMPDGGDVVTKLVAGFYHTCAQFYTGFMRCWGSGDFGQLGYGNRNTIGDNELGNSQPSVLVVSIGFSQFDLVAGGFHTCAQIDGTAKCWGRSNFGQLGYGATGDQLAPPAAPVSLGAINVARLVAGVSHTCALLDSGNVMCWGRSNAGQLGYGNTNNIGDDELPSSAGAVPFLQ